MAMFMCNIHFWSLNNERIKDDKQLSRYVYHDKKKPDEEFPYCDEKQQFCLKNGISWAPSNKRPHKLHDNLNYLEELLNSTKVIKIAWLSPKKLLIVFVNGIFVFMKINLSTGDIVNINIDKSLVGKLYSEKITDAIICEKFAFIAYLDPKLTFIYFNKPLGSKYDEKDEKLSSYFSSVQVIDLYGPSARKNDRKLSLNVHQNTLLVWWQCTSNEVWPWTPASTDRDRANLFIYNISGSRIELVCCLRQEAEPMIAGFSKNHPDQILTVEESPNHSEGSSETFIRVYEICQSQLKRVESSAVPIPGHVMKVSWNCFEDKIAILCKNGFLTIFDRYLKAAKTIRKSLQPCFVSWHKNGALLCTSDLKGVHEFYDAALNLVPFQLSSEQQYFLKFLDLTVFFTPRFAVNSVLWTVDSKKQTADQSGDGIFILFERGPMIFIKTFTSAFGTRTLDASQIISCYIRNKDLHKAVTLATCFNWNMAAHTCYKCVSLILNHLLRFPLTDEFEGLIEATLGTFYSTAQDIADDVVSLYRDKMGAFARRFFHHLMRHKRMEKAFLLAVDINSADLFMDIYHYGMDHGEIQLAETAKAKAIQIQLAISNDSASTSSDYSSSSESSDSSSENDEPVNLAPLSVSSAPSSQKPSQQNSPQRPQPMARGLSGSYPWGQSTALYENIPRDVQITIESPSVTEDELNANHRSLDVGSRDENYINQGYQSAENEPEDPTSVEVIHFGVI